MQKLTKTYTSNHVYKLVTCTTVIQILQRNSSDNLLSNHPAIIIDRTPSL